MNNLTTDEIDLKNLFCRLDFLDFQNHLCFALFLYHSPIAPKFTVKVGESKTLEAAIHPETSSGKCNFQPGNLIFTFSLE